MNGTRGIGRLRILAATLLFVCAFVAGCGATGSQDGSSEESLQSSQTGNSGTSGASDSCSEVSLADEAPDDLEAPLSGLRPLAIEASGGESVEIQVETARSLEERAQGLMFRESLGENCGMIFVYDSEQELSFWMRNTLVPLSIAYLDSDGRIVSLHDMEPLDETGVPSEEPAQYALEVNQGFFDENGVEVGDSVELPD